MTSQSTVGFCGLGLMGAAMVSRLLRAGHCVHVWNRSAEKVQPLVQLGAVAVESPADMAKHCALVILCLTDEAAVSDVVLGPHGLLKSGAVRVVLDHSSISPEATVRIASQMKSVANIDWLDAPVSGGVRGADSGTLAIMLGGDPEAMASAMPYMQTYSRHVTHMGGAGAGQWAKLCNQTIVATTLCAIAEAVHLAQRAGIDAEKLPQALAGGWADSVLLQTFVPRMLVPPDQSIGSVATMLKDVDNIAGAANTVNAYVPVLAAVRQRFDNARQQGLADQDLSQIHRVARPA